MQTPLRLRDCNEEEKRVITKLARSRTAPVRLVERARILKLGSEGQTVPQIAQAMGLNEKTVRKWFRRFEQDGLAGLEDSPRPGTPSRYTTRNKRRVLRAARTHPRKLGLPYSYWTFERLAAYVREQLGLQMKKTRIFEVLMEEGFNWRQQEAWLGERPDSEFVERGLPEFLFQEPPESPSA